MEDTFHESVHKIGYGYLLNIISCLGVLGNILVLVVLFKHRGRGTMKSAHHYLILMTSADITVLIFAVVRYRGYFGYITRSYGIFLTDHQLERHAFCIDPYVQVYLEPCYFIALGVSSYITVFMTLDRYLVIRYPLLCMKSVMSSIAAYLLAAVSLQLTASLTSPLWFSYTVKEFHYRNKTIVAAKITDFGKESLYECRFHQFVIPLVWYVIPWCVMALFNTLLYAEVQKSSDACNEDHVQPRSHKRLSTVVLCLVFVHMLCSFPRCMVAIYNMVHGREGHGNSGNMAVHCAPGYKSRAYTCITVGANLLNVLNSCINIVIYCGLGSKFRQELVLFFKIHRRRINRVAPTTCAVVSLETKLPDSGVKSVTS
ncbi:hypothetical protein Btru_074286 [Bulinus truncatus]|nr:hypothetical protein Btru_074286 [Bulinus truncatus]